MAVVTGGLGLPEEGAIVAGGYGASEPAAPGVVNFTLTVTSTATSSIAAEVLGGDVEPPVQGGGNTSPGLSFAKKPRRKPVYVDARLYVHCQSTATIVAEALINFDAELEQLLLIGAI